MFKKSHGIVLDTLDFIFNKMIPKKLIIMLIVCGMTIALQNKIPDAFYYAVVAYIGGSAVVSSVKKRKGEEGGPE